jgi:hypothetical protein
MTKLLLFLQAVFTSALTMTDCNHDDNAMGNPSSILQYGTYAVARYYDFLW